jgi:branched-chain amino acid transport system substrate-binding protein
MKRSQALSLSVAFAALISSLGGLKLIDNHLNKATAITSTPTDTTAPPITDTTTSSITDTTDTTSVEAHGIDQRISFGEETLIAKEEVGEPNAKFREAKLRGVEAMSQGNYSTAVDAFEEAIKLYPNAPETLIYLNNARIGDGESLTLAIAVPIRDNAEDGEDVAKEMLRGIAHKQNEVNSKGGINGIPLRVLIVDDDSDDEVAKQVAQALVDDDTVLGVIGHFTSDTSLAASDIYQNQGLVMISPTSTSVALSTKGNYIFRSLTTDGFNAAALVDYMLNDLKLRNAAIFYNSDSAYSTKLVEVFKERLFIQDGKVVDEFDLIEETFNANESVQDSIDQGAEVVVLFHNTGVLSKALEVITANEGRLPILSGDSGYKPEMLELHEYTQDIIVTTVPWVLAGSENTPFVKSARQLWKADVSWRTAMTYDAAQALVTALEKATNREDIRATISDPNFSVNGVSEVIKFQENTGDRDGSPLLVTVEAIPGASGQYRFAPVKGSN